MDVYDYCTIQHQKCVCKIKKNTLTNLRGEEILVYSNKKIINYTHDIILRNNEHVWDKIRNIYRKIRENEGRDTTQESKDVFM